MDLYIYLHLPLSDVQNENSKQPQLGQKSLLPVAIIDSPEIFVKTIGSSMSDYTNMRTKVEVPR